MPVGHFHKVLHPRDVGALDSHLSIAPAAEHRGKDRIVAARPRDHAGLEGNRWQLPGTLDESVPS